MGLPFFRTKSSQCDKVVAIDLGSRATKAVFMKRSGDGFELGGISIKEAPGLGEKAPSADMLAEHFREIYSDLGAGTKDVVVAVGVQESLLRLAEMPMLPTEEMRTMLKFGSKNYLKEELNGHVFDCHPLPLRKLKGDSEERKYKPGSIRQSVIVGGMSRERLEELVEAVKMAGLNLIAVIPGHIGPLNAFEYAESEMFNSEVVALVDVGFRSSSISIMSGGELALNRVVNVGGDNLTSGLADTLSISYEEAEGIKIGMPQEVQSELETILLPLGRELRASADFFEHQNEKPVTQILISGGGACSEFLAQTLQAELMAPCRTWNPSSVIRHSLDSTKEEAFELNKPRLTVAVGAASTVLN